jgi:hypothetical protein
MLYLQRGVLHSCCVALGGGEVPVPMYGVVQTNYRFVDGDPRNPSASGLVHWTYMSQEDVSSFVESTSRDVLPIIMRIRQSGSQFGQILRAIGSAARGTRVVINQKSTNELLIKTILRGKPLDDAIRAFVVVPKSEITRFYTALNGVIRSMCSLGFRIRFDNDCATTKTWRTDKLYISSFSNPRGISGGHSGNIANMNPHALIEWMKTRGADEVCSHVTIEVQILTPEILELKESSGMHEVYVQERNTKILRDNTGLDPEMLLSILSEIQNQV